MSQPCPAQDDVFDSVAFKSLKNADPYCEDACLQCNKRFIPGQSHFLCDACLPSWEAKREAFCRAWGIGYPAEYQERDEQQAAELERTLTK